MVEVKGIGKRKVKGIKNVLKEERAKYRIS